MLDTFGMPSASDARYGAPPEASRSPLRLSSSVRVTRSMACCPSPSAIICVKTRRCWSKKKSSGRRCSIARFSALLSSKIAPRTERSASRLFGKGFSSVASTGIGGLLCISPFLRFCTTISAGGQAEKFSCPLGTLTCPKRWRIVGGERGVDHLTARAFATELELLGYTPEERLTQQIVDGSRGPDFPRGRIRRTRAWL